MLPFGTSEHRSWRETCKTEIFYFLSSLQFFFLFGVTHSYSSITLVATQYSISWAHTHTHVLKTYNCMFTNLLMVCIAIEVQVCQVLKSYICVVAWVAKVCWTKPTFSNNVTTLGLDFKLRPIMSLHSLLIILTSPRVEWTNLFLNMLRII